jgi:hypothetical protein
MVWAWLKVQPRRGGSPRRRTRLSRSIWFRLSPAWALGAAYLAGLDAGLYPEPEHFATNRAGDRRFHPMLAAAARARKYGGWQRAVRLAMAPE